MITSSLCLSSVVPISLYFSVVLSKFNKGLWQFRKSCEVMFENESQVVKVIINGLHDCHFLLIVVYTLYRERGILHGSLSSFGSMPFTNKCPRGYQCVYTLIFYIVGITFRNQLLMHAWNYRNCFFFFAQLASNALFICCEWGFPHEGTSTPQILNIHRTWNFFGH